MQKLGCALFLNALEALLPYSRYRLEHEPIEGQSSMTQQIRLKLPCFRVDNSLLFMNLGLAPSLIAAYLCFGLFVCVYAIRRKKLRKEAGEFLLGLLVWPIYVLDAFDEAKQKLSRAGYKRDIQMAIGNLPRCGRLLRHRQTFYGSSVGVFTVSAADCHGILQEDLASHQRAYTWPECEFLMWLGGREDNAFDVTPVPKFWERPFSSAVLKLYQKKKAMVVCLTCNADSTAIRVNRETYGRDLIDAYKCPNGHLLFAERVGRFTPASLFKKKAEPLSAPANLPPPKLLLQEVAKPTVTTLTPEQVATMTIEYQQLATLEREGRYLSLEERKKLFMLKAILGGDGLEPAIEKRTLSLEEAANVQAFGGYTFGHIQSLLLSQGHSRGDVLDFLKTVSLGGISIKDAVAMLGDIQEWNRIREGASESQETFFQRRKAQRDRSQSCDPARN
jgi:hypothetical protein